MQPRLAIRSLTLAALAAAPALAVGAATSTPPRGTGPERGVAVVQCLDRDTSTRTRARAAILDLGVADPVRDAVLTAAHGLPPDSETVRRNCTVFADGGRTYRIRAVFLGGQSDWAVLVTSRRLRGAVARLTPVPLTAEEFAALLRGEAPLELRRLLQNDHCRAHADWLSRTELEAGLFLHSCRSWPGLSGSPLLLDAAGAPALIGIHLGRVRRPIQGEGPPLRSIGQRIDATIAAVLPHARALVAERR